MKKAFKILWLLIVVAALWPVMVFSAVKWYVDCINITKEHWEHIG